MGLFGNPGVPHVPLPPPAAHAPTLGNSTLQLIGLQARQRARAAEGQGFDNTIQTSPQGVTGQGTANGPPSTLLGK